ncbi:complex I subunit 1/NuoH family protein [Candidatus Marinarcus aquaticus]|uniref:NADH-quinone oxidoreductase subunit H n=1 Tax=Candidatus Marinarcus aquaticus TaxID=2044504 RepID=A0A4Q0XTI9_9BACT|nr:complex I subunit 1 family protein [Candidatus Marinarcus aquaticus]RXJ56505.1 NADH-quinone oxidoreductase subunit H [Candidatus Marinarcus aquaticus]
MDFVSVIIIIVNILLAVKLAVGTTPILVWWERRVAGFIQGRTGPNRCNIAGIRLGGLIQSIADMLKLVFKEDFTPGHIKYKFFFTIAPAIVFFCSLLTFAVIPFADTLFIDGQAHMMQAIPMHLGIMWFLAYAGLATYGIILGGYSSNSKYGLLSSIRTTAQVISYEASMALAIISVILSYGSIHLNDMVTAQGELLFGFLPSWGIIIQPLAALIFIVCAFAEANRTPFDIAEGESEIVAGYHTEYSAMRFGLFQVGEFAAMGASAAFITTLFLGGYHIPWMDTATLKANIDNVLMVLILLIPVLTLLFIGWMQKNNTWDNPNDPRAKETAILTKVFLGLGGVVTVSLAYVFLSGLSENGVNIATAVIQISTFMLKFFFVCFVFIWVRWTLLRFRYDQLQMLGWKVLLPLALLNIFITALVVVFAGS